MAKLEPRMRNWDYAQLINKSGSALSRNRPREVYEILLSEMKRLTQAKEAGLSYILRSAVEDTDQGLSDRPSGYLVDGLRSALLNLADTDASDVPEVLTGLLREEHPIYRRLALFALTERPRYLRLIEPRLILPPTVYDVEAYHEQMRLIHEHILELPQELQDRIHAAISVGLPPDLLERDEEVDRQNLRLAWRLLNVLPDEAMTEDERKRKEELTERHGSPEHPLFLAWFSGVQMATAPATAEQLKVFLDEGGHERLLQVLRNPGQYFEVRWSHDEELLWEELGKLVGQDPESFLGLAELLDTTDFPDAWRYFNAYEELAKAGASFTWRPLLAAAKRLVESEGAQETHWSVAHLLKAAAWDQANLVEVDDLRLVTEMASLVVQRECTPLEGSLSMDHDLATHQLNSPAGAAADTLIHLLFREALGRSTEEEKTTAFPARKRMGPVIGEILDQGVSEGWGGVELRHSIGEWLHLILWADSEWLTSRLDRLLPPEPKDAFDFGAWRGFWAGHLRANRLLEKIMLSLKDAYVVLLADAGRDALAILAKASYQDDRDALGAHLRAAWLRGYEGFGRDGLYGQFIRAVPDETRAHLVTTLAHDLAQAMSSEDEDWRRRVLPELDAFWKDRTEALRSVAGQGEAARELSAFVWWLEHVDKGVEAIGDRLNVMAQGLQVGFEIAKLLEYLLRYVDREPEASVRVLRVLADRFVQSPEAVWYIERLPELVSAAWTATSDPSTRAMLRGVVSDLLEHRGIDLRKHIE
jgi:hypothetical protein